MMSGYGYFGSWWLMGLAGLALCGVVLGVAFAVLAPRRRTRPGSAARALLDQRLVSGDVEPPEYRALLEALNAL